MTVNFQNLSHPGIRDLIPYKPGKSIEELAKEQGLTNIIKLASNENPYGCSPLALEAIHNLPSRIAATYPSPMNHPLLPKLAAKHQVGTDQIFLCNGSDPIFGLLLTCFALNTSKAMLTHDYVFSTYAIQAQSLGIPVISVHIDDDWQVDTQQLIKACGPNVGLIFIANPNNPTGRLIPHQKIKALLESIPESTLLILDEAYHEFSGYNSISWLPQHKNLVITRSFSKMYGMAGLRLGYALAHPEIISTLIKVQLPFNVSQVALAAGCAALDDAEFVQKSFENNHKGMEQVVSGLKNLSLSYIPSNCNFITFNCGEDGSLVYNFLLNKGIIVRPLHPYKMNDYIRVTIGTKEQNNRFLQALATYFERKSK